jgi:hypothetical protein
MAQFDFSRVTAAEQPRNNAELMVDIETLGTGMGAPVITIGAVLFCPYASDSAQELLRRVFVRRIDISDAYDLAPKIDGSTLRWWFEQKDAAIKALVGDDAVTAQEAFKDLEEYCNERGTFANEKFFSDISDFPKVSRYWAKDPDFDMRLMQHYYDHPKIRARQPWKFWECRSVRTVQDLAYPEGGVERPDFDVPGIAHDAGWDAITQAMMVQVCMRRLGLSLDQDVTYSEWKGLE